MGQSHRIRTRGNLPSNRHTPITTYRSLLWNVSVACVIVWVCVLIVSFSGCCLIVGSLWNVSVCVLWVCVGCLGGCVGCLPDGFAPFYSSLFYSILPYPILFLLYSILFYSAILGYIIIYYRSGASLGHPFPVSFSFSPLTVTIHMYSMSDYTSSQMPVY